MRLIDADALMEQMQNHYEVRNSAQNSTMDECCMMVFNAKTVDAVEVVRCKDCIHLEKGCRCRNPLGTKIYANYILVEPDDFCSYGERKEGAD